MPRTSWASTAPLRSNAAAGLERPARRQLAVSDEILTGKDESALVAVNGVGQPIGVRLGSDHDEERACRESGRVTTCSLAYGDLLEVAVATAVNDLRAKANGDVGGHLDLADQVVRHRCDEALLPHEHRDGGRIPRQVQRGLPCRVARPDDVDVAALHGFGFSASRTVEDASPDQGLERGHTEPPPLDADREDDRRGCYLAAIRRANNPIVAPNGKAGCLLRKNEINPE